MTGFGALAMIAAASASSAAQGDMEQFQSEAEKVLESGGAESAAASDGSASPGAKQAAETESSDAAASSGDDGTGSAQEQEQEQTSSGPSASCKTPAQSFTAQTPVLMAGGSVKPISEVKVGDTVETSVPGQGGLSAHEVQAVEVTYTDHDFADVTVAPVNGGTVRAAAGGSTDRRALVPSGSSQSGRGTSGGSGESSSVRAVLSKIATLAAAAAVLLGGATPATARVPMASAGVAAVSSTGSPLPSADSAAEPDVIHTTFLHPFYDQTRAAFVEAQNLHVGDLLQTPTGSARVAAPHLFHADTTTYDLTIDGLHTFYVVAGDTPVLVHNIDDPECGPAAGLQDAQNMLTDLQSQPGGDSVAVAARLDIGDGDPIYGVNAHGQSFDRSAGVMPQAMGHAESDTFIQALNRGESGGTANLYVAGKIPCSFCRSSLAGWGKALDLDQLNVYGPNGYVGQYLRDGGYRTLDWGTNPH